MAAQPLIPYLASCDLRYGGGLHGLLAGSIYAGTVRLAGYCCSRDAPVASPCRGCASKAELYYLDPRGLARLDAELGGWARRTIAVSHGGASIHAEAHVADPVGLHACRPEPGWLRVLLALPPALPPPATPLAAMEAVLRGYEPCMDGKAFCPRPGAEAPAALADIYTEEKLLREWLEANSLELAEALATLRPRSITALAHAPAPRTPGATP